VSLSQASYGRAHHASEATHELILCTSTAMDGIAAKINARAPKSRKELKVCNPLQLTRPLLRPPPLAAHLLAFSSSFGMRSLVRAARLQPKTHHFFYVLVWLTGWIAPPVAVLIRFGIGRDFFINILCTICGYFPGHFHK
jgi:uncharacterized membrane protein YqaE (UPF0057 family)